MAQYNVGDGIEFKDRKGKVITGLLIDIDWYKKHRRLIVQTADQYRWKFLPDVMKDPPKIVKLTKSQVEAIRGKQAEWDTRNAAGLEKRQETRVAGLQWRSFIKPGATVEAFSAKTGGWYQTQVVKVNRTSGKVSVISPLARLKSLGINDWRLAKLKDTVAVNPDRIREIKA